MDIRIEWRAAIHRDDREALRKTILDQLRSWTHLKEEPGKVIVSRPSFDPYDERLVIEVRSEAGKSLGGGRLEFRESWRAPAARDPWYSSHPVAG